MAITASRLEQVAGNMRTIDQGIHNQVVLASGAKIFTNLHYFEKKLDVVNTGNTSIVMYGYQLSTDYPHRTDTYVIRRGETVTFNLPQLWILGAKEVPNEGKDLVLGMFFKTDTDIEFYADGFLSFRWANGKIDVSYKGGDASERKWSDQVEKHFRLGKATFFSRSPPPSSGRQIPDDLDAGLHLR